MSVLVVLAVLVAGVTCRMAGELPGGFGALPSTFSCNDRPFGYYADVDNDCRAFHVCQPVFEEDGTLTEVAHFSFMCGQRALFSQDSLTCSHAAGALPCSEAVSYYEVSNAEFGIIPEEPLETTQ